MPYLSPDVLTDEVSCAEAILEELAARLPGWVEHEGSVETSLAEAVGVVVGASNQLLVDEARRDYASGFGENILGLRRQPVAPASAVAAFTLKDAAGYTVPAGTVLGVAAPSGERVAFTVLGDWTCPAGQTALAGVPVASIEAGAHTNGCTGAATLDTGVAGVVSAQLTSISSGGADEESLNDYVERVADRARRMHALAVTADDFAALALDHPSVARALAVNLLDPANPPAYPTVPSTAGHVTVYPVDSAGQPLSAGVMGEVLAMLAANRVLNVAVHVEAPTLVAVNVVASVWPRDGYTAADAIQGATTGIQAFLAPALWGRDSEAPGLWSSPDLAAERVVTSLMVAAAAKNASPAVGGVAAVTVNGGSSVALPGWAVLPQLGTLTVTAAT